MSQLSSSTTQISDTLNILNPNKRLEQLIAKSWLDGKRLSIDKEFLVKNNILSQEESIIFKKIEVVKEFDTRQGLKIGVIDAINLTIRIPYPEQPPEQFTPKQLQEWVASNPLSPPWNLLGLIPRSIGFQDFNINLNTSDQVVANQPFNIIRPNKKFSQLIARSWLDNEELYIDRYYLIHNSLLSQSEAPYVIKVNVDEDPDGPPYIGGITINKNGYKLFVPYPKRPDTVGDDELTTWVNSAVDSAPYTPFEISQWIPYTC